MSTLNYSKSNNREQKETEHRLSNLPPKVKNLYLSFMKQHNIPITLTDNTYVLNFKESGKDDYLISGSHEKIKIMAALFENFQYNHFLFSFYDHIRKYFNYLNVNTTISSGPVTVNLFKNYSSLNDIEFFQFDFSMRINTKSELKTVKMFARFYVNHITPSYYIDNDENVYCSVYYKNLSDIFPCFINSYKSDFEQVLQQPIKQVDDTIVNLIKMMFI